jgi:hypothetical protein
VEGSRRGIIDILYRDLPWYDEKWCDYNWYPGRKSKCTYVSLGQQVVSKCGSNGSVIAVLHSSLGLAAAEKLSSLTFGWPGKEKVQNWSRDCGDAAGMQRGRVQISAWRHYMSQRPLRREQHLSSGHNRNLFPNVVAANAFAICVLRRGATHSNR